MSNNILLQLKIDSKTKKQADNLFFSMGLDTPTAIRMFLKRSIMHNGIPFDVIYENKNICPLCNNLSLSKELLNEVEEIRKNPNNFKTYSNFSELAKEIEEEIEREDS